MTKHFAVFLISGSVMFILGITSNVSAIEFDAAGYRWSVSDIRQNGDQVIVQGRVYGPACRTLRANMHLRSEEGHSSRAVVIVENTDSGGRLFTGSGKAWYYGNKWQITDVYANCLAQR